MLRIAIIGCSGVGKSTLARRLGEKLGLPVVHLDALYWEPGWTEPQTPAFRARVTEALKGGRWVSDGNYFSKTADLRFANADLIIWIDQPRWLCLWRITWRSLIGWGRTRRDLGPDCPEKIDGELHAYVWGFDRLRRPRMEAALEAYAHIPIVRLSGDKAVAAFVASMP